MINNYYYCGLLFTQFSALNYRKSPLRLINFIRVRFKNDKIHPTDYISTKEFLLSYADDLVE